MVTVNPSNTISGLSSSSRDEIPQLDGQLGASRSPAFSSQIRCENCGKTFETVATLQNHTDQHDWGCDECQLCFTTKYLVDLHELEHHGHHPDSIAYIRDHIPETTKRLFEAGHRQRSR